MIPGELLVEDGEIELNVGRKTLSLVVANTGDRPIQVGSHYHFFETNPALRFDRKSARGFRLNIAAGTAVRFEPGQERTVELLALAGDRVVYGFNALISGRLDSKRRAPTRVRPVGTDIESVPTLPNALPRARGREHSPMSSKTSSSGVGASRPGKKK